MLKRITIIYFFASFSVSASSGKPLDDPECQDYLNAKGALSRIARANISIISDVISVQQMHRIVNSLMTVKKYQAEEIKPWWYEICDPSATLTIKQNRFGTTHKSAQKHILNVLWENGLCAISILDPVSGIAGLSSIDERFVPESLNNFFYTMLGYKYSMALYEDLLCLSDDSDDGSDHVSVCSDLSEHESVIKPSDPSNWLAVVYSANEDTNERFAQYLKHYCGIGSARTHIPRKPELTTIFTIDARSGQSYGY